MNYIRNNDGDYWSNVTGWTAWKHEATMFTNIETQITILPVGGHWENDEGRD